MIDDEYQDKTKIQSLDVSMEELFDHFEIEIRDISTSPSKCVERFEPGNQFQMISFELPDSVIMPLSKEYEENDRSISFFDCLGMNLNNRFVDFDHASLRD